MYKIREPITVAERANEERVRVRNKKRNVQNKRQTITVVERENEERPGVRKKKEFS